MKLNHKALGRLTKTPLLITFAAAGKKPELPAGVNIPKAALSDFNGGARKMVVAYTTEGPAERLLIVGLGAAESIDTEGLRRAAAVAAKRAEAIGVSKATMCVPESVAALCGDVQAAGCALAEGAVMGSYRYTKEKTDAKPAKLGAVTLMGPAGAFKKGVTRGAITGAANCFARDLQNAPGNLMTPIAMAAAAKGIAASGARIKCKIMDEKAMEKMGMGLLLGVSAGSDQPARFIHLTYTPKGKAKGKVALVGKGLTFDAGGISLKSSAKMDDMRFDMSGGAAVLGAFHALAQLDVPCEVHGVVACSENLMNGAATKPGDIHTGMGGKTVEVLNTDAEGRLILGDALTYTESKIKPDTIIDLATLTGAVVVGLGHEVSGMFPTTDRLRDALTAAGEATGEAVWPLPLLQVHKDGMKGVVADLKNISAGDMGAGSSAGAAFLSYFVDEATEWCHMDIAGTAWGSSQRDWVGGPRGSGVGTRLLIHYLENRL